jgi:hypothetical protein
MPQIIAYDVILVVAVEVLKLVSVRSFGEVYGIISSHYSATITKQAVLKGKHGLRLSSTQGDGILPAVAVIRLLKTARISDHHRTTKYLNVVSAPTHQPSLQFTNHTPPDRATGSNGLTNISTKKFN